MKNEIRHTWFYDQPRETIWAYLTTPELMAKWLMPTDFKPVAGHAFTFAAKPIPSMGLSGTFYCKVLEIIPMERLVYSWKAGPEAGQTTLDTLVEWTLASKGNGTELRLVHSGFNAENHLIYDAMFDGWDQKTQKIRESINTPDYDNTTS